MDFILQYTGNCIICDINTHTKIKIVFFTNIMLITLCLKKNIPAILFPSILTQNKNPINQNNRVISIFYVTTCNFCFYALFYIF